MSDSSEALAELLPSAAPTDSEDVSACLETAGALWKKGDRRDAVRWLQRGATAAEAAGDDDRALALARRAAELSAEVGPPSQSPPSVSSAPDVPRRSSVPPKPANRATSSSPPRPSSSIPSASAASRAPSAVPAASNPPASRPAVEAPPTPEATAFRVAARAATSSVDELVAQGRALRVAVKRSAVDGALYVVRRRGSKLPMGAREAVLILDEADPAFFSRERGSASDA